MNNLLFVYGTLLDEGNEYAIYLKNNSRSYAEAKLRGKLYDIGEYPGAVLSKGCDEYVYGVILQLDDPESALKIIDEYEGFGKGQPFPNEFVRVSVKVETGVGEVICWVYLYNLPVTGLPWLKSGRYVK
jgi:gamma-glutamylcyclotransferase (GGCT)/AIG2-like uncharacterized protein YtfP